MIRQVSISAEEKDKLQNKISPFRKFVHSHHKVQNINSNDDETTNENELLIIRERIEIVNKHIVLSCSFVEKIDGRVDFSVKIVRLRRALFFSYRTL